MKLPDAYGLLENDAAFANRVIDEAERLGYVEKKKGVIRLMK